MTSPHQPDDAYFDVMAEQARRHWWYRARRALAHEVLVSDGPPAGGAIDVGCGTGENMAMLADEGRRMAVGTDLSVYALRHAVGEGRPVLAARAEDLPFASGAAAVLASMDVIEHLDDDALALSEYRRVLHPGGALLITVPAYMALWSEHDEWAAHRRRYRAAQLRAVVEGAGFVVTRCTYYNSFLVPPAWLLRRTPLRRLVKGSDDEVGASSPVVDRVFSTLAAIERWWARRWRVPFGLSILLVARKPLAGSVPGPRRRSRAPLPCSSPARGSSSDGAR